MVTAAALLAPLFVQVLLTFALLIWLGYKRIPAVRSGTVQIRDIALGQRAWPPQAEQAANAFDSQFQLPVLFYVAVILAATLLPSMPASLIAFAWLFVILRIAHAVIHVTTNDVPRRFYLFTAGMVVLILMWIDLFFRIAF